MTAPLWIMAVASLIGALNTVADWLDKRRARRTGAALYDAVMKQLSAQQRNGERLQ